MVAVCESVRPAVNPIMADLAASPAGRQLAYQVHSVEGRDLLPALFLGGRDSVLLCGLRGS